MEVPKRGLCMLKEILSINKGHCEFAIWLVYHEQQKAKPRRGPQAAKSDGGLMPYTRCISLTKSSIRSPKNRSFLAEISQ